MATDIKQMMEQYKLAWNSHDVNKIISFFTEDGIYEDVATGSVNHSKKEISEYLNTFFADVPDFKIEIKTVFGSDDWAGSEVISSGTHVHSSLPGVPSTGRTFSLRAIGIFQLHKGKISHQSEYYNLVTLLQQIGVMPGQPK
jgi:steroid delta-isomerase-like uncharacterized protein